MNRRFKTVILMYAQGSRFFVSFRTARDFEIVSRSIIIFVALLSCFLSSCVSIRTFEHDSIELKTLLSQDDPLVKASVVIVGLGENDQLAVCNGVYVRSGVIVTAAHCLLDGFSYSVFAPVALRRNNPFTHIKLQVVPVVKYLRHPKFKLDMEQGVVQHDIGLVRINLPKYHALEAVNIAPASIKIVKPQSLTWKSGKHSYFEMDQGNQVTITGYKIEKDNILKGMFLVKDAANFIGPIAEFHSRLLALNPGTSVHRGVSGSGVFYRSQNRVYVVGVTSHFFPGVNLLSATDTTHYIDWIQSFTNQHTSTSHSTKH